MNEDEQSKILSAFKTYNDNYDTWWKSRDENIDKKSRLKYEKNLLEPIINATELELDSQSKYGLMLRARLNFYDVLKQHNFTNISFYAWRNYRVSRIEDGNLVSYDIAL